MTGRLVIGTLARTITTVDDVVEADMPHPGWVRIVIAVNSGAQLPTVSWIRVPAEATVVEFQPKQASGVTS